MGSVFLRGRKYYIGYRFNGKRYRDPVGSSKTLAKKMLAVREAEIIEGRFIPGGRAGRVTFKEFSLKFWRLHGMHLKSQSWKSMLRRLCREFGDKPLNRIRADELQELYNQIRAAGKVATANRYMTLMRLIFNRAKRWGDFRGELPTSSIDQAPEPKSMDRFLRREEIARLVRVSSVRLRPVVVAALLTGLRRGELMALMWEDIDFDNGILRIRSGKSDKPREIPLGSRLCGLLERMGPVAKGRVFQLSESTLKRHFERARKEAGLGDIVFHRLRHTFASHFVMKTGDLPTLQKLLGHHSHSVTERYAHLNRAHIARVAAQVEGSIGEAVGLIEDASD